MASSSAVPATCSRKRARCSGSAWMSLAHTRSAPKSGSASTPKAASCADVRPAIAERAVCVVPLRVGGGTRLKILQAMALGTPVVATSKGAEGLDVHPERDILIGDTPERFSAQVLRVLEDPALGCRLAAAARLLVSEQYTWERSGERLNEAVSEAVSTWKAART